MSSRLESVVLGLREIIVGGAFAPGAKVTEGAIAERLGVSRTPVRLALQVLESEGLVTGEPNKGFVVKGITFQDVLAGFDVRGTLEGLACRLVAETGMRRGVEAALRACVERGDVVCEAEELNEVTAGTWTQVNREFHRIIMEAAENAPLLAAHELVCRNPLVGPASLAFTPSRLREDTAVIAVSQQQHRAIWEAIRDGQGSRAEALAREHIVRAGASTARHLKDRPFAPSGDQHA